MHQCCAKQFKLQALCSRDADDFVMREATSQKYRTYCAAAGVADCCLAVCVHVVGEAGWALILLLARLAQVSITTGGLQGSR